MADSGRKSRGRRIIGCIWGSAALALLAGGLLILTVPYAESRRTFHAYGKAEHCSAIVRPGVDCVRYLETVVTHVEIDNNGKGGNYEITLTGPTAAAGRLRLDDSGPVLSRLRAGDRVRVEIWRGRRTTIAAYGQTQATSESPLDVPLSLLSIGVATCLLGLLAFDFALRYLNGRLHFLWNASGDQFSAVGRVVGTLALVALAAGAALASAQETAPEAFFLWAVGMALIGGIAAIRRHRRNRW